jgi:hypothetical protein
MRNPKAFTTEDAEDTKGNVTDHLRETPGLFSCVLRVLRGYHFPSILRKLAITFSCHFQGRMRFSAS